MVWRGNVFLGRRQVLSSVQQKDPSESDIMLEDARGDHAGWFLLACEALGFLRAKCCRPFLAGRSFSEVSFFGIPSWLKRLCAWHGRLHADAQC